MERAASPREHEYMDLQEFLMTYFGDEEYMRLRRACDLWIEAGGEPTGEAVDKAYQEAQEDQTP